MEWATWKERMCPLTFVRHGTNVTQLVLVQIPGETSILSYCNTVPSLSSICVTGGTVECSPINPCRNGGTCDATSNSCVCTGGLVYQTSIPMQPTCQDPFPPEGNFEGCICPPGLYLNDSGVCVPPLQCFGESARRLGGLRIYI